LGPVGHQNPILLTLVGSVLGLALQPGPTTMGPAAKQDLTTFGREGNTPNRNS